MTSRRPAISRMSLAGLAAGICALASAAELQPNDGLKAGRAPEFVPVTDAFLQKPADSDWPSFRRTTDGSGFSPLTQISKANVHELTLAWTRPISEGIQESTPLVYNGVMYLPNPNDITQAIDAATGELLWEHRRQMPPDLEQYLQFPSINRNIAIFGRLIIDNGFDDFLYALDAETGKLVWETQQLDYRVAPSRQSSGPIIANGKVVSGRGCEPNRGPEACVITAHDAITGKELWRTSTIDPRGDAGDSWGGFPHEKRSHVGSWMVPSYDAELNIVYVGTSVSWPAPKFIYGSNDKQYLYHNSTLALDADSGEIVWYYQHLVDHWDLDHVFERVVAEVETAPDPASVPWINPKLINGEQRKVITGIPGKTGIVYTLDAKTGEFLWATPTVTQNVVQAIDGQSGKVVVNPQALYHQVGDENLICPGSTGGKNWFAGAYNPHSKMMFQPLQNACMKVVALTDDPATTEGYGLLRERLVEPGKTNLGSIWAISAETGRVVWKHEQRAAITSLFATASGLLFGGDTSGHFRAYDQDNGEVLWEVNLGSQVTGFPITFAVHGTQYIAVSTGNALLSGQFLVLTPEIRAGDTNQLFVYALPNAAVAKRTVWDGVYTKEQAQRGEQVYLAKCQSCHAADMRGGPAARGLLGPGFQQLWKGKPLDQLYAAMRSQMPPGQPGSLDEQAYVDLLAAVLQRNGFPPGDSELPPDPNAMQRITIAFD
jgi:PQQ-dependent dehydrogenase (methanol/ethanol family)